MTTLGNNIKKLREANEMTQQEVADFVGINRVALSYVETGVRDDLTMSELKKMANLFMIDASDLYDEDLIIALPLKKVAPADREAVSHFYKIIRNYIKIKRLQVNAV